MEPQYQPVADHAVLVGFGAEFTEAVHAAVLHLDQALTARPFPGFIEAVPAYVNLLVDFDPVQTDHARVIAHLRRLQTLPVPPRPAPRLHQVAVCYDDDLAPDLSAVARQTGLAPEAVIAAHLAGQYAVCLYGFAPGYAYLAGVPDALRLDRKPTPVRAVPAGSVIIAGAQCLVTTLTMPTGWWIIGRSAAQILTGDPARPFLFDVGDRVAFRRIGRAEHAAMAR